MQRSHGDQLLYTAGLFSTALALALVLFTLYLVPYIFFHFQYDVPEFIVQFTYWFERHHDLSGYILAGAVLFPFLLAAVLLGFISKVVTEVLNHHESPKDADVQVYPDVETEGTETTMMESLKPALLAFLLIGLVIAGLVTVEYIISVGPPDFST